MGGKFWVKANFPLFLWGGGDLNPKDTVIKGSSSFVFPGVHFVRSSVVCWYVRNFSGKMIKLACDKLY